MPKPFHELTLEQFADLVSQFTFTRRIDSVHMHHTWRPNHADFASRPPLATIEGMHRFHTVNNGWSDIAQHVSIDPRGIIWTGRDWNRPPASSTGFNGNSSAGPFMFETIGDFDTGRDPFGGAQRDAVVGVIAHILKRFDLPAAALKFHNQMSSKTCPGSAIDYPAFVAEVQAALDALAAPRAARARTVFGEAATLVRKRTFEILASAPALESRSTPSDEGELSEEVMDSRDVEVVTGTTAPAALTSRAAARGDFTPEERELLRPHVINLRMGEFSAEGKFQTSISDVRRIFDELLPDELARRQAESQPLRLVFYAHGGLTSEEDGIRPILERLPFYRQNGMYPIFFCWETGLKETISDIVSGLITGQRGVISDLADSVIEALAGDAGRAVWGQMKRSAKLACDPSGGAHTVAELTRDFWNQHRQNMEIHAIGHSAGSIFHAFFLPALLNLKTADGVPALAAESLHFLAPALTTELFKTNLMPRVDAKKSIRNLTMYTMLKSFEEDDTAGPYQKSLLYLVSRAFEPVRPTPILGLEESLRDDPALIRLFGLSRTVPGKADVLFSKTAADVAPDRATESAKHGDFDNDAKTMNSVARRILRRPTAPIVSFVDTKGRSVLSRALEPRAAAQPQPANVSAPAVTLAAGGGARRALCIGIDAYPAPHALGGCVNDARNWAKFLEARCFQVDVLLDQQATRERLIGAMRSLIGSARSGDVVVIQYAGHGTQVKDLDGDETSGEDQAFCPVDFASGRLLIDDEVRAVFGLVAAGVNLTCFFDCCHSGTISRMVGLKPETRLDGSRARFIPRTRELDAAHEAFRAGLREDVPAGRVAGKHFAISFSACQDHEVALESNGAGDFTTKALSVLSANAALTNQAFYDRVIAAFGPAPRQTPNIDCAQEAKPRPLLNALGAPETADLAGVMRRLGEVEQRLSRLGV